MVKVGTTWLYVKEVRWSCCDKVRIWYTLMGFMLFGIGEYEEGRQCQQRLLWLGVRCWSYGDEKVGLIDGSLGCNVLRWDEDISWHHSRWNKIRNICVGYLTYLGYTITVYIYHKSPQKYSIEGHTMFNSCIFTTDKTTPLDIVPD